MKNLRDFIDNSTKKIMSCDKKNRCQQFDNLNGCCTGGYCRATEEEINEIKEFLNQNQNIKQHVLKNQETTKGCIFHDTTDKSCLIFNVRPIFCRFVSYRIYEKEDCFKTCSPLVPCQKDCSTIISFPKDKVHESEDGFKYVFLKNEKKYFIDNSNIPNLKEYLKKETFRICDIYK